MEPDLAARVAELERHVARLDAELKESRGITGTGVRPPVADWAPPSMPPPIVAPTDPPATTTAHPADATGRPPAFGSEALLKWGGVGLVVLAVAFAVSTAISRGWIGPELQLAIALIVSFGLIGVGLRAGPTRRGWTHALVSGGTLALFTTVASDLFVDETASTVALGSTAVIGLGCIALAWRVRSEWVAAATLAGGATGWAVIVRDDLPFTATWSWYLALVGGLIILSVRQRWFAVRLAAHLTGMVAVLALVDEAAVRSDRLLLGVAVAVLTATLCWVPSIGDLTSTWQQIEVQASALTAPWVFAAVVGIADTEQERTIGWLAISVAAGAAALALMLSGRLLRAHAISLFLGSSVVFSIGVALLMGTAATLVALAVQGVGLVVLGRELDDSPRVLINALVLLVISIGVATVRMIDGWGSDLSAPDDVANALIVAAAAAAAWRTGRTAVQQIGALVVLALVMVWLGSVLVHLPQGQALVSVSWAAIGIVIFVVGAVRQQASAATVGLVVLGLTVAKLLTIDLREVDALWRAALFFVIGVGLLRLGFLLPRWNRDGNR